MSELIISTPMVPVPLPAVDVSIRPAVIVDLPFIDSLQKMHTKMVGWMPMQQLEQKIASGQVLLAEVARASGTGAGGPSPLPSPGVPGEGGRVGYLIAHDQYFKHDDVGIIYQLNVLPAKQRGLIGASLLKAQFERSAYGCKLYCCWCAQDLAANYFWESMGFVALAYRAGGEKRGTKGAARVHIFWQKRIRSGDTTTPWWFPSKTAGGAIREDRIVLPIPPGTHWSDAKPLILPAEELPVVSGQLPGEEKRKVAPKAKAVPKPMALGRNGLIYAIPRPGETLPEAKRESQPKPKVKRAKRACDPRLVSAARELRDRWLEHVNASPIVANGKYDVSRVIADQTANARDAMKMLAA
jgi:hypothetical protein